MLKKYDDQRMQCIAPIIWSNIQHTLGHFVVFPFQRNILFTWKNNTIDLTYAFGVTCHGWLTSEDKADVVAMSQEVPWSS